LTLRLQAIFVHDGFGDHALYRIAHALRDAADAVADDSPVVRDVLQRMLTNWGFDVIVAL